MMEWINVKDQLPEVGQQVLIFNNALVPIHVSIFERWDSSDIEPKAFYDITDDCGIYRNVTHWMPLPESCETCRHLEWNISDNIPICKTTCSKRCHVEIDKACPEWESKINYTSNEINTELPGGLKMFLDSLEKQKHPITEFKDIKQAYEYLEEWQSRLFLDDWTIKLELTDKQLFIDDEEVTGKNTSYYENKAAFIEITTYQHEDNIEKVSQEHTMIHELLHCKYGMVRSNANITDTFYGLHEHMLIEQMAKSLLMAKYNLSFDWFKNFKEE